MRKFDRRRVGSYYGERIGSSMEDRGNVEAQEQGKSVRVEYRRSSWECR